MTSSIVIILSGRFKLWRIKQNLEKLGIGNITNCENEKDMLNKTKEYYSKYNMEEDLKDQLIILENKKINTSNMTFITELGLIITLSIALITSFTNIYGKITSTADNFVSLQDKVQSEIDGYKNIVQESNYKLGIYNDEQEYYNKLIEDSLKKENDIRNDFQKKGEIAQNDIKDQLKIFYLILSFIGLFMAIVFFEWILFKPLRTINDIAKNIAININKSTIEARLKEIGENKSKQELEKNNNNQLIIELKEIQKLLKCNNDDKIIVKEACNKIVKNIF